MHLSFRREKSYELYYPLQFFIWRSRNDFRFRNVQSGALSVIESGKARVKFNPRYSLNVLSPLVVVVIFIVNGVLMGLLFLLLLVSCPSTFKCLFAFCFYSVSS